MDLRPLDELEQIERYRTLFTDAAFWAPYVKEACARHGLAGAPVRAGVPGTYPAFIAGERWLVKFFGRLFDGQASFEAEREAGRLAALDPAIPTARVVASGELGGAGWPWPYLIFEYIPGESIGQARDRLSAADRLRAARMLGDAVRRIHALPLAGSPVFPRDHAAYRRFLEAQRTACVEVQRARGALPERLVAQIEAFMPPVEALVDDGYPPHLIHADLTADHLLGRGKTGHWKGLALIDFGDAMTGSLYYELAALHLDLFGGDRRMLAAFLAAYGLPAAALADLPRRALATALLHRFDVFQAVPRALLQAQTLDELAYTLWGQPG